MRQVHSPERDEQIFGAAIEQIIAGHPHLTTPGFMPMETCRRAADGTDVVIPLLTA